MRDRHVLERAESNCMHFARNMCGRHEADASWNSDKPHAVRKLLGRHVLRGRLERPRDVLGRDVGSGCERRDAVRSVDRMRRGDACWFEWLEHDGSHMHAVRSWDV
jgi:hypothetical protein